MTFAYWEVAEGASIHEHRHPQEELWSVIEGEFEITVADESTLARPGTVALVGERTLACACVGRRRPSEVGSADSGGRRFESGQLHHRHSSPL